MPLVRQFEQLWESASAPPDVLSFLRQQQTADTDELLAVLRADQRRRWMTGRPLRVEDYLSGLPELPGNVDWKLQLAIGEFEARLNSDRPLRHDEISSRFPDLSDTLRERLRQLMPDDPESAMPGSRATESSQPVIRVHHGQSSASTYINTKSEGAEQKGRYRLDRVLGEGGFGRVYLGFDDELMRQVAIKVPTKERFQKPEDAETYLAEARTVASLDHPHIVPVYDMGRTEDGSIYVVSKFIEGSTLDDRIKAGRPPERESAQLLATVARALQHAHDRRLIHRDIKPANILLEDKTNTPFVADFGLAIREEDYLKQNSVAGTPAYMSPEQIRGEGHRLDGRSDIFALGVILYELLTGSKPFRGSSRLETVELVLTLEPRPPREYFGTIPAELERICLKALSKRTSDRYATAAEFADDLEHWLKPAVAVAPVRAEVQVVPKGLRSFDAGDADFFLDLLPGPRNRDGLPESIAFWKQRIEQTDPEQTFSVGLIYGPSGCGKSSLVKAGLLPHLSKDVIAVYVEATADDTETRILRGLRKRLPDLSEDLGLADTLAALRRGVGFPPGNEKAANQKAGWKPTPQKVAIIIDQFEQWLHAHRAEPETELMKALRQCDGGRLQTIVMVRDDFWLAASRFMNSIEIDLVAGHNIALVDLFDVEHAKAVLIRFGQSFGKLPANSASISADEQQFVSNVVSGLAQDGKVVSVRLSLFAEMVKGKPWTAATLDQVGGTQGIGVNFLEETFVSRSGNPKHRQHQEAARKVLRALLPELGTDIKGHMRSQQELLEASGYVDRSSVFADLLRILDGELRLITPTDPEGDSFSGERQGVSPPSLQSQYYQLTHDYLVPSLREWLTRKQKETRKGRAELKLEERSAIWNAKRENKQLPTVTEWLGIRVLTDSRRWTESQRAMMRKAARVHGTLWGGLLLTVMLVAVGIQQWTSAERWKNLKEQTETAAEAMQNNLGPSVPFNLEKLRTLPVQLVLPELQTRFTSATNDRHKLSLAFALAGYGKLDAAYLLSRLDDLAENDTRNYVTALQANPEAALAALKAEALKCTEKPLWRRKARLSIAACALGDTELALDVCVFEDRPDPEQRTLFIDEFPRWDIDLNPLHDAVKSSDSPALRSGICLAVGQLPVETIIDTDKESWKVVASGWFVEKSDTSTHSAAGWMLRHWGIPLPPLDIEETEMSEEQRQRIAPLAAKITELQQQIVAAEAALSESELALEQQFSSQLTSIAIIPGDYGFLAPSGTQLVIMTSEKPLLLHDLETSQERILYELAGDAVISPGWKGLIAMVTAETNSGTAEVLLFDPDDSSVRSVGHGGYPTWAADESKLFFQDMTTQTVMFVNVTDLGASPEPLIDQIPSYYPSVSPDATKVAFFADEAILVLDIATRTTIAKYATPGWAGALPVWMSDSQHVSFGSYANGDERGLWILDTKTGLCFMAVPGNATRPSWSRDGSRMLYENRHERKIHVVSWSPEQQQRLADKGRSKSEATVTIRQLQLQLAEAKTMLSACTCQGVPRWRVNHEGLTMLMLPAGAFLSEVGQKVEVQEEFWVSDREVTRGQFEQFMNDASYAATEKPMDWPGVDANISPTADHPAQQVSWYDAVLYCNWLSQREGLQPCYERTGTKEKGRNNETLYDAWRLIPGSTGYRLLQEAEWEYACRAGTSTEFSSGDDATLLVDYCRMYPSKKTSLCGEKLPNAWGLHDAHGNVWEWCWETIDETTTDRVLRGGAFNNDSSYARSANRRYYRPAFRVDLNGFRVARTLNPVPFTALPPAAGGSKFEN